MAEKQREQGWYDDPYPRRRDGLDGGTHPRWRYHDGKTWTNLTSETDPKHPPEEGWYRDPDDPTEDLYRYWDGRVWRQRGTSADLAPESARKVASEAFHTLMVESRRGHELIEGQRGVRRFMSVLKPLLGWPGIMLILLLLLLALLLMARGNGDGEEEAGPPPAAPEVAAEAPASPTATSTSGAPSGTAAEAQTSTEPTPLTSFPPTTVAHVSEFTSGRILDPGPIDWAISYDYRILDNHLTFSILPGEDGEPAEVVGYGEVVQRREYEAEQPDPNSDEVGTYRRLFTAVVVFDFTGTWDGKDPGLVDGTVTWNVPADRLDVEYNESTVGTYPLTDGIFTGLGPPGGVFTATYSPTTGEIRGEVTVDPWGVLGFQAVAFVVEP